MGPIKLRPKARQAFADGKSLDGGGSFDGAASRLYYAVYQAMVSELESRGFSPEKFGYVPKPRGEAAESTLDEGARWPHWLVRQHGKAIGLTSVQSELVKQAWAARVKADYYEDSVEDWEVEDLLQGLPDLLEGIGVKVA